MAEIAAPAPDTVVIRWNTLFQSADVLSLKPMPEHILGEAMRGVDAEPQRLGSHAYWTAGWVGMGPYRLAKWEPGAFLEGAAFDGYVFGRPKIDRITVKWSGDPNTAVTRLLSGDVDMVVPLAIYFDQVGTLRQEWAQTKGTIILTPTDVRYIGAQMRPDLANPKAVLDLRVRKASLHAIDRQALVDALLEPGALVAETAALPTDAFYDDVLRVAARYPFDTRLTDQLMAEAGYTKGADGVFTSPTEGRYAPELFGISEGKDGRETTAVADYWRKAGIDARLRLAGSIEVQNSNELKATYPAWRDNYTFLTETLYGPSAASPQNRWGGRNKIGWVHPEFDRLFDLYTATLQLSERQKIRVQQYKLINDELPGLPLNFELSVTPYVSGLQGPTEGLKPTILHLDNLHAWQWVR
jgi:peptide/nickel transport system substrate-binding protein